jgi:hypothetical protein
MLQTPSIRVIPNNTKFWKVHSLIIIMHRGLGRRHQQLLRDARVLPQLNTLPQEVAEVGTNKAIVIVA